MNILASTDYENSVICIKTEMMPYYIENGLEWNDENRLKSYSSCSLFKISLNEQVGFFMLREDNGLIYLAELHIFSQHRNMGYGTLVLRKIKEMAFKLGHKSIRVRVFKNSPAYALYLRNGYALEEELPYTFQLMAQTHNKKKAVSAFGRSVRHLK
jgi:ribosomal protein S18 acetylase RimI-like enzyme